MNWSHPEIAYPVCMKGLEQVMQHVLQYPECGMVMHLDGHWGGSKDYEFEINGISDSGDVTEPELCKRCGGLQVFLNKAPIAH